MHTRTHCRKKTNKLNYISDNIDPLQQATDNAFFNQ